MLLLLLLLQDANLVGGLLGCFGQLFTANLAPGWQKPGTSSDSLSRSSSSTSAAAAAAANADASSSSNGAAGEQKSDQQQEPCGMLTVKNNDITRVRAELDSASFVSAVAPRIAVRLLHIVALAVVLKFFSGVGSGAAGAGNSSSSCKRLDYVNKVGMVNCLCKFHCLLQTARDVCCICKVLQLLRKAREHCESATIRLAALLRICSCDVRLGICASPACIWR
jgi:hypothetical protein